MVLTYSKVRVRNTHKVNGNLSSPPLINRATIYKLESWKCVTQD